MGAKVRWEARNLLEARWLWGGMGAPEQAHCSTPGPIQCSSHPTPHPERDATGHHDGRLRAHEGGLTALAEMWARARHPSSLYPGNTHHTTQRGPLRPQDGRGAHTLRGHCLRKGRQAGFQGPQHSMNCNPEPLQGLHISQRSSAHDTLSSPYRKAWQIPELFASENKKVWTMVSQPSQATCFCPCPVYTLPVYTPPVYSQVRSGPLIHPQSQTLCLSFPPSDPSFSRCVHRSKPPPPNGSGPLRESHSLLSLPLGPSSLVSQLNMPKPF